MEITCSDVGFHPILMVTKCYPLREREQPEVHVCVRYDAKGPSRGH
jgi:hypothetical protein